MMRRVEEYRGLLAPVDVAEGINAARRNARRLHSDAKLLFDAERHASAASLAVLSIEESGKVAILRRIAVAKEEAVHKEWRRYRDHRSKNGMWIFPAILVAGARRLKEFARVVDRDAEHTAMLNTVKQIGTYTDCYRLGHWSEPATVISGDFAKSLLEVAELALDRDDTVTAREIELWVKFVGPDPSSADGLVNWATAMFKEGLSQTPPGEYVRFIFGEKDAAD